MSTENIIEIRGLKSFYNSRQVLFDISFAIPKQQRHRDHGSERLREDNAFPPPYRAKKNRRRTRSFVDGQDLGAFSETMLMQYRRRIGVLFQSGALFNSLSLAENIAMPLRVHTKLADGNDPDHGCHEAQYGRACRILRLYALPDQRRDEKKGRAGKGADHGPRDTVCG